MSWHPASWRGCVRETCWTSPFMFLLLVVFLSPVFLVLPSCAALDLQPAGPGGGGWLYAGAFDPSDDQTMLIGTDMCGVFRTDDGGSHWRPWNDGLMSDQGGDHDHISYVQDLIGVYRNNSTEYYAATLGGIFHANSAGPWVRDTDINSYYYSFIDNEDGYTLYNKAIEFSSFAYSDSTDILYAGSGSNRTDYRFMEYWYGSDLWNYSGIGNAAYHYSPSHIPRTLTNPTSHTGLESVWMKDLGASGAWAPISGTGMLGSVRDISAANINGVDYVAFCTINGIYLYNSNTGLVNLVDLPLYLESGGTAHYNYYRSNLLGWNVHLTSRGTLYASMSLWEGDDTTIPGGVYRLFRVTSANPAWYWVGDGLAVTNSDPNPPTAFASDSTMADLGRRVYQAEIDTVEVATGKYRLMMNVVEGVDSEPDIIVAGNRAGGGQMFRGVQPNVKPGLSGAEAHWSLRIYRENGVNRMYPPEDGHSAGDFDMGYQTYWGTNVIDKPSVYKPAPGVTVAQSDIKVLTQFNGMLHVSGNSGKTWNNVCVTGTDPYWTTNGYEEVGVHDIECRSDGTSVIATQDNGVFASTTANHVTWERYSDPVHSGRSGTNVELWENWQGSGELILATIGAAGTNEALFMKHPSYGSPVGEWTEIPIDSGIGVAVGINDLEMIDEDIWLGTYQYWDDVSEQYNYGVIRGVWSGSSWTVSHEPNMTFVKAVERGLGDEFMDIEYCPARNRVFAATIAPLAINVLENPATSNWEEIATPVFDSNVQVVYDIDVNDAGTVACFVVCPNYEDYSSYMYYTTNLDDDPEDVVWTEYAMPDDLVGESPQAYAVCISPYDDELVYFGLNRKGSHCPYCANVGMLRENTGLWSVDLSGSSPVWTYEAEGTDAEGVVVKSIAFNPYVEGQMIVGTWGQGLYLADTPVLETSKVQYEDASASTGLNYQGTPYSSVSLDYNDDGKQDLFVAITDHASKLYRCDYVNLTTGVPHFVESVEFETEEYPQSGLHGLAVADYDNDGDEDLVAGANSDNNPRLYRNDNGHFTDQADSTGIIPAGYDIWSVAWADYDDDEQLDLAIGCAVEPPSGNDPQDYGASRAFLMKSDIYDSGTYSDVSVATEWNQYTGAFLGVTWGDIDNDGDLDAFLSGVLDYSGPGGVSSCSLFVNNGDGTFTRPIMESRFQDYEEMQAISGASFVDIDNDLDVDLVLSTQSDIWTESWIYFNGGGGVFDDYARIGGDGPAQGHSVIDHDLDGNIDVLLLPEADTDHPWLITNKYDGSSCSFVDETSRVLLDQLGSVNGATAYDWNTDGDLDLYMGRPVTSGYFFYKATDVTGSDELRNNWIGIDLLATGANIGSCIGAKVYASYDGKTRMQVVDGGSARGGQRSHDVVFGLGDWNGEVLVFVRWPNGVQQMETYTGSQLNQVHQVSDETDPTVLDATVACSKEYIPGGGIRWTFTWKTQYRSRAELDRVEISGGDFGNPSVYQGADGVVTKNTDGTYSHQVSFTHRCYQSTNIEYTVHSCTDLISSTSATHTAKVKFCFSN